MTNIRLALLIILSLYSAISYGKSVNKGIPTTSCALLNISKAIYREYPDSAHFVLQKVKKSARDEQSIETLAEAYFIEGNLYRKVEGKYEEALSCYYNAFNYFKGVHNYFGISKSLRGLGFSYLDTYNYPLALTHFLEEQKYEEMLQSESRLAHTHYNIGKTYRYLNNSDSAKWYLKKAISIYERDDLKNELMNSYLTLGSCFRMIGNYAVAESYYYKTIKLSHELHDLRTSALALHNLGSMELERKNHEEALQFFKKTLEYPDYVNDQSSVILTYADIGDLYRKIGKIDSALIFYHKVTALEFTETDPHVQLEVYKTLSDHYESIERYKQALAYRKASDKVSIPLANKFAKQKKLYLASKSQNVNDEYKKSQLTAKNKTYEENLRVSYFWIALVVVLLLIILLLLVRNHRKKESLKSYNDILLLDTIPHLKERDRFLTLMTNRYNLNLSEIAEHLNKDVERDKFINV